MFSGARVNLSKTTFFFSTCPDCKHSRRQCGYEWTELVKSLSAGQAIDAYCLTCDVVWPITAQERFLLAKQIICEPRPNAASQKTIRSTAGG
jgi:hypothetical protein